MTNFVLPQAHANTYVRRHLDSARLLCVLFFFSGFPALVYQLTWQRALFRIFGVNSESVTIVVTAFMLGLGCGSVAGGWVSRRSATPVLLLLAAIEAATGVFGVVSLRIFDAVGLLTAGAPLPAIAAINLLLVAVPTLLMGATLPLLVAHLVRVSGKVGESVGQLYYANTLGAACACLVSALLLFPFLGMQGAILTAAAMNGLVALGALLAHVRGGAAAPVVPEASATAKSPVRMAFPVVMILAAVGGYISLSFEVFFFRVMSFATGSSATAFAVTLGIFLAGLATGARSVTVDSAQKGLRRFVSGLFIASAAAAVLLPAMGLQALHAGVLGVALLVVYAVARAWGGLLPLLSEIAVAADDRAGMRASLIYLANIIGAASGAILTGFVLVDRLGLVAIAVFLTCASLAAIAALSVALPLGRRDKATCGGLAFAGGLAAVLLVPIASAHTIETLQQFLAPHFKALAETVETRAGLITVDDSGSVYGNGLYDGRFNTDILHDSNAVVRPYALNLIHPAPRDVLMIGLSSGSWAQVLANNPDVASLTIVEINPGYVQLIARHAETASILHNPKVTIVADDGRRWLRLHPDRLFDAIVSNTTWHFRANVTNLLSTEFLELAKARLAPGGVMFYNTTGSERVQRTACVAFPYGARFSNHMVVSSSPIAWDFPRWKRSLASYTIDGKPVLDLSRAPDKAKLDSLMAFETGLHANAYTEHAMIEPCSSILARTADREMVTDDNMGDEWRVILGLD